MAYSERIELAVQAAALLHRNQVRKGPAKLPYVSHLFSVALLVADYTDDEDVIVAALLHDTLEDTEYSPEELENDFGGKVRKLVEGVSEHINADGAKRKPWKERKQQYLEHLASAPEGSLIISAADKIHNMRSIVEQYYNDHDAFRRDFGGSTEERLMMYQKISNVLNRRLTSDIVVEFNHIFNEYKKFISNVQNTATHD